MVARSSSAPKPAKIFPPTRKVGWPQASTSSVSGRPRQMERSLASNRRARADEERAPRFSLARLVAAGADCLPERADLVGGIPPPAYRESASSGGTGAGPARAVAGPRAPQADPRRGAGSVGVAGLGRAQGDAGRRAR